MKFAILLASVPAMTLGTGYMLTPAPQPVVAKTVATEGVRAVRADDNTFRRRWSVVSDLPPMTVVKNEATILIADAEPNNYVTVVTSPGRVRRVSLRTRHNICSRHGLRKIVTGRSWRCRR